MFCKRHASMLDSCRPLVTRDKHGQKRRIVKTLARGGNIDDNIMRFHYLNSRVRNGNQRDVGDKLTVDGSRMDPEVLADIVNMAANDSVLDAIYTRGPSVLSYVRRVSMAIRDEESRTFFLFYGLKRKDIQEMPEDLKDLAMHHRPIVPYKLLCIQLGRYQFEEMKRIAAGEPYFEPIPELRKISIEGGWLDIIQDMLQFWISDYRRYLDMLESIDNRFTRRVAAESSDPGAYERARLRLDQDYNNELEERRGGMSKTFTFHSLTIFPKLQL